MEQEYETLRSLDIALNFVCKDIQLTLEKQGESFTDAWTYENCRSILRQLNDEDFYYVMVLLDCDHSWYTSEYRRACMDENDCREFEKILLTPSE
jgi:hypothetical protein